MSYDPEIESPVPQKPAVLLGRFPYGWDGVTATRSTGDLGIYGEPLEEQLPFPQFYKKQFTHPGGTVIVGAAKRGGYWEKFELKEPEGYDQTSSEQQAKARKHYRRCMTRKNQCKPTRYIVWGDRSLRRTDKVMRNYFSGLTPEQQSKLIGEATGAI